MKTNPNPISIFKPGTFTATNGVTLAFSEADLLATATAYNPALHEAPLVIGHPALDDPAYGWTAGLLFADGLLQAQPRDISPEFADWIDRKFYKKISAKFYMPEAPGNPVPGVYYLRHIGFLGAQPPAVKGLPDPAFADADFLVIEFSEGMPVADKDKESDDAAFAERKKQLDEQQLEFAERDKQKMAEFAAREKVLADKELAVRKQALVEFSETQIAAGRLLPKDKLACIAFMMAINEAQTVEFSEADQQKIVGSLDWFKEFLANQPKSIEFAELGAGDKKPPAAGEVANARKARAYHQAQLDAGNNISFGEAVDAVLAGEV